LTALSLVLLLTFFQCGKRVVLLVPESNIAALLVQSWLDEATSKEGKNSPFFVEFSHLVHLLVDARYICPDGSLLADWSWNSWLGMSIANASPLLQFNTA
jgi:hypothetical protein